MGAVSYYLLAPRPSSKIHDVRHVSELKKHLPPHLESDHLDQTMTAPRDLSLLQPATILQSKLILKSGSHSAVVRWHGRSKQHDSWEDAYTLRPKFPALPTWGQVAFQGMGSVMTWPTHGHRPKATRRNRRLTWELEEDGAEQERNGIKGREDGV